MQPRPENDLLHLLRILEALEKIRVFSAGLDDPFVFFEANDGKEAAACLMQLAQIGEQSGKISVQLKKKYNHIDWQKVKNFRNRIVHDYSGLDRFISFEIIKEQLPVLKGAVKMIVQSCLQNGTFSLEELHIAQTSTLTN